uniref:Tumor necrosis factor alpha-induced protein 8-like protein 3 n=1 Tax=Electrophorus electricus TaxID=8005 RepID=A0A4W4GQ25_ELEEL
MFGRDSTQSDSICQSDEFHNSDHYHGPETFNSKNLALQAQKKILSKMATMAVANLLTDDTSSEILDELYKASREYTKSKKEAHKIIKDVIKIALKIGILYRNHQFSPEELETVERFKKKMNQAAMTVVSFYEVEYTFDRGILSELLLECRDLLHELVEHHLTTRSHGRIDHVFNHFADVEFLAELYGSNEDYRLYLRKICDGINKLLDEGVL